VAAEDVHGHLLFSIDVSIATVALVFRDTDQIN
jgi:hypothetical protein